MTEYRVTSNFEDSTTDRFAIESLRSMRYDVLALKKIKNATTGEYFRAKGFETPDKKKNKFESEILKRASDLRASSSDKCEFLIGVSMYNEKWEEFRNTLKSINEGLISLYENTSLTSERVICVIMVDGMAPFLETFNKNKDEFSKFFCEEEVKIKFDIDNLNDCTFEYLIDKVRFERNKATLSSGTIPETDEEDKASSHDSKEVTREEIKASRPASSKTRKEKIEFAHMFSQKMYFGNVRAPLNIILCVKQYNKRKLNSHLWLFGGFCEVVNPEYVMLLDIGTKPMRDSLFYLYDALKTYPNIAGCCGEICPMAPSFWNLVVQAQVVEYKFSHMLDKALESVIGFITVLPGAFSAYRWSALQGDPLWKDYFKSIFAQSEEMDTFNSNIYLAEDRVLCLSLVSKAGQANVLRYVRKSVAETDVPETLIGLLAQRRRWINGSWFALIDTILKCKMLLGAEHSCFRKCFFVLLMLYYTISALCTWLMVGIMFVAFDIAVSTTFGGNQSMVLLGNILLSIYISIIIIVLIMSLGTKPKMVEHLYISFSFFLGVYQVFTLTLICKLLATSDITNLFVAGMAIWFGLFIIIALLNWQVMNIIRGSLHYLFMIPTYINILLIYAICNTHDCTWGNRPDTLTKEEQDKLATFERFRARWTCIWTLSNAFFALFLLSAIEGASPSTRTDYFIGIGSLGLGLLVIRITGGMLYLLVEWCKTKGTSKKVQQGSNGMNERLV